MCSYQATSWRANRFALASPAFIASVCSSSRLPNIKVRVHPFPESAHGDCGSCDDINAPAADAAGPALFRQNSTKPKREHLRSEGFSLSPGARFWAMPVSFIAAVHTRQVEALAQLAESASMQLLLEGTRAVAPAREEGKAPSAAYPRGNRILEVLTATEGQDTHESVQVSKGPPSPASSCSAGGAQVATSLSGIGLSGVSGSAAAHISEVQGMASETSLSFLTPRQREAVSAATTQGTRIVTIEGRPTKFINSGMQLAPKALQRIYWNSFVAYSVGDC